MPRATHKPQTLSLQIRFRLLATILAAGLMLAGLAAAGLVWFSFTDQAYQRALRQAEELQASALNLNAAMVSEMLNTRAFLISGAENVATRRWLAHQEAGREFDNLDQLLAAAPALNAPSLTTLHALHSEYDSIAERLIALRASGRTAEALALFDGQSDPLVQAMQRTSDSFQNEISQGRLDLNTAFLQRSTWRMWMLAAFFLTGMALTAILLIGWVTPLLSVLEQVESTLINAAETQVHQPITNLPEGQPLVQAYNSLVERLRGSNTAILKYVRYLHHELNTLLASVLGYGYMLADPELRPEDASMETYGQVIVQQTQQTVHLVEDFTLAARIEGNQYAPELQPVRLAPLLASVIEEMRAAPAGLPRLEPEDCAGVRDCAAEPADRQILLSGCPDPLLVLADALSLEHALRKVIDNALKFSTPEKPVYINVEICPGEVLIHVQDQGCGIAPEDLARLFHPFTRLCGEGRPSLPGNGLGLYLASAILRAHHGSISVQSQVGIGSLFTLTIPQENR